MGFLKKFLNQDEVNNVYIFKENFHDKSDKFNWQTTVNLLIIFTFLVSNVKNIVNKIISCTVPINFSENQEEYVNQICYISNKYYVDDGDKIIINQNFSSEMQILNKSKEHPILLSYYIWVPYILLIQALLFLFIKHIWYYMMQKLTCFDMHELIKSAQMFQTHSESNKAFDLNVNHHLKYILSELSKTLYQGIFLKKKAKFYIGEKEFT